MSSEDPERRPLLNGDAAHREEDEDEEQKVNFTDDDPEDPRQWPLAWKYAQTFQIFLIGLVVGPMASSAFAPATDEIASDFQTSKMAVLAGQTVFVCMLGVGPLFLAPMSETFGRRIVFLLNLAIFTLLQIPTALSPNVATFIAMRTLGGFFGSVGVANGGGTISDLFETRGRAPVLGCYLIAPLLGPSIGPLIGGLVISRLHWRWIFWVMMILSGTVTVICYFFLHETQSVTLLEHRKARLENEHKNVKYKVEGASDISIPAKIKSNSSRAIRILTTQPIVATMSLYQALIFSSMYSLYAQFTTIWSEPPYNFDIVQVALTYLGPIVGFLVTAAFIVFYIDRLYVYLSRRNDDDGRPEYRLPMANVGAICLPISLFWFGWTIEARSPWPVPLAATLLFGASQVSIFNTVQTYYIDSFEQNAASALAAGAFLRSMFGGLVTLAAGPMFSNIGYGWGMSVFGFLSLLLMPAPLLFYWYGQRLREKFPFKG